MAADPKLDLLKSVPLFARLSKSELQRLGQLTDELDFEAGRVLMRQGEFGHEMFVIVEGRVRVDRDGQQINEVGAGAWFGEMALLSRGKRTATVTTTERSRMFVIGHREFTSLMDLMPTVKMAVLECLADRIRSLEPSAPH